MIKLKVYYHTEETDKLTELGLEDKIANEDFELRDVYFVNIDSFYERRDGDTSIFSGGTHYLTPIKVEEIINKLNK
jgi:hypothetical protein